MQFEIPAEMLQGGYGGGGQQRQVQQQPKLKWPRGVSSEISPDMDWLASTEWKGKTAKYALLRDGTMESTLKECKREGACGWSANGGHLYINTPTLGVTAFKGQNMGSVASLQSHVLSALGKVEWVAVKPGPAGNKSRLTFNKIVSSDEEEGMIAEDLYEVLGVAPDDQQSAMKKKYRRASIQSHPDKCSSSEKAACEKRFDELRQAYEILGDKSKRAYYDLGGMRLVRNIETGFKETEAQKAQLDAQLNQVPHNHPMRRQVEMQVQQQKAQFTDARVRPQIEAKFTSEEKTVEVPVTLAELFHGTWKKSYDFPRLVICRGCRANPDSAKCKECGRCPPEKLQIPQYSNTMFGKQVTGHKEKFVESMERCKEVPVKINNLKVPRGASPGILMKTVNQVGHQAPGRLPGKVHFTLAYAPDDTYQYAGDHLYTVLTITLSEALFGFEKSWPRVGGDSQVKLKRPSATNGEVIRIAKKGMFNPSSAEPYGDIFVRIHVELPQNPGSSVTISKEANDPKARLRPEDEIEVREDRGNSVWRSFSDEVDEATLSTAQKPRGEPKTEL